MLLAASNNSGSTFNTPINVINQTELISRNLINSTDLSVVSDMKLASDNDGNVYVVWSEWPSTDLDFDIFMRKSVNNGSSFESVTNLSNDTFNGFAGLRFVAMHKAVFYIFPKKGPHVLT